MRGTSRHSPDSPDFGARSVRIYGPACANSEIRSGSGLTSKNAANIARASKLRDLVPAVAGIRAQAVLRDGGFAHDFVFAETARTLHVCNAPSPAATSAIPIARAIASKIFAREQRQ